MDRSQHSAPSLDELRQIQYEARTTNSLPNLRRYFDRVHDLRRLHSGDFDIQLLVAEAQEVIIARAREIRSAGGPATPGESKDSEPYFERSEAETLGDTQETAGSAHLASQLDKKSWKRATYLALIVTAAILVGLFYLIQAARRSNFPSAETPKAAQQQPAKTAVPVKDTASPNAAVAPVSDTPTLRLYTDLIPGTVSVDEGEPQDLKDGELVLDHLKDGRHSVKVAGRSGTAAFSFEVSGDNAPQIVDLPAASNAIAVLVSAKDGKGHMSASAPQSQLLIDGKPAGEVGAEGLAIADLGTADHELQVNQDKDRQRFVLTYTTAPVLTVFVKSDPNAGTVVVIAKQDGVSVLIDDKLYRRKTEAGQIRIPLKVGEYQIQVHKDGFIDPPAQSVEVKKAEETALDFKLEPVANIATLQVKGAVPGTAVFLDDKQAATVGADGSVILSSIKSGEHTVELRLNGAIAKKFGRKFQTGETVVLAGPDVILERVVDESTLRQTPVEPPAKPKTDPQQEAIQMPGEQVRKGGGFVHYNVPKTTGHYLFQAHSRIGGFLKHGKLQWYAGYQDSQNFILFSVDGKHASIREMRDGKSSEVSRIPFDAGSDEWVQVDLTVKPNAVGARIKTPDGGWSDMGSVASGGRDFTQDKVGFYIPGNDEVAVSNFRFVGR